MKTLPKKKTPDAPWENKKVPKAPFESQAYGLVQLAKVITKIVEQNSEASAQLLEYLKKQESRKIEVNIPEIKIPEVKVPSVRIPDINVPETQVNVKMPEVKIPEIKFPEQKTINGWKFKFKRHNNMLLDEIEATKVE